MTDLTAAAFLLIDKPSGWTSFDVVAKIRSHVGGKVGHAGTLDPMATGLLVLGLGGATRLLRFLQASKKEYLATALFGVATDSLDADGDVTARDPLPVTDDEVSTAMERFRGEIMQVPPMVSARKVDGRRLYALAREGVEVEREARSVTIHNLELIDLVPSDFPEVTFRVTCSTGTYVRTLADDIARSLGGRAHLTALRRVRIGALHVDNAVSVEEAVAVSQAGDVDSLLLAPSAALSELPEIRVDEETAFAVRNGRELPVVLMPEAPEVDSCIRVGDRRGDLIAVYRRDLSVLRPEVVLA